MLGTTGNSKSDHTAAGWFEPLTSSNARLISPEMLATVFSLACILTASVFLISVASMAQDRYEPDQGLYVKLFGGLNFNDSSDVSLSSPSLSGTGRASFDTGYTAGIGLGYAYGYGLAGEVELLYTSSDLNALSLGGSGNLASGGDIAALSIFGNAVYTFENIGTGRFRPYVGAGLGYIQEVDTDIALATGDALEFSGNGFAWQVKSGIDYRLSEKWSLDLGGRYIDGGTKTLTSGDDLGGNQIDYSTWQVTLGVTRRF